MKKRHVSRAAKLLECVLDQTSTAVPLDWIEGEVRRATGLVGAARKPETLVDPRDVAEISADAVGFLAIAGQALAAGKFERAARAAFLSGVSTGRLHEKALNVQPSRRRPLEAFREIEAAVHAFHSDSANKGRRCRAKELAKYSRQLSKLSPKTVSNRYSAWMRQKFPERRSGKSAPRPS